MEPATFDRVVRSPETANLLHSVLWPHSEAAGPGPARMPLARSLFL